MTFTGTFIGAGHTISNLTANADEMTDDEVYTEHNIPMEGYEIETCRPVFAIFMNNAGTIEDVCFKDCVVKNSNGTIVAMVCAVNDGEIKDVIIDGGEVIGGDIWLDFNCFVGGFAAMNGQGTITNCICNLSKLQGNANKDLVRYFCGKTWGKLINCYATNDCANLKDNVGGSIQTYNDKGEKINDQGIVGGGSAPELSESTGYGFTYAAVEWGSTAADADFSTCMVIDAAGLKNYTLYKDKYDTNVWSIKEDSSAVPTLIVRYNAAK